MISPPHTADLLFAGAGLSGLTLALECARRPFFQDKKIVLVDHDDKTRNDRTWCFWAKDSEPLPPVVHKSWQQCRFYTHGFEKNLDIAPYRYHMVRGIDFYQWAKTELDQYPNVMRVQANILSLDAELGILHTDAGIFQGKHLFNSAKYTLNTQGATRLLQHFKGWFLETSSPAFEPEAVTFMDYRLEQRNETRFVYVLPITTTRALVEFTVFSPALCPAEEYDAELRRYLEQVLGIRDFGILEVEFGVIPMTDAALHPQGNGRVINIGTAGGFVKASSGYAFLRTQRKSRAFAEHWAATGVPDPAMMQSPGVFRALDSIMLRVLRDGSVSGEAFFTRLFQRLPAHLVLRFLDEDSRWGETLRLLGAPPTWPFLKAAWQQIPYLTKNL